jgi:hypothetical protein
MKQKQKSQAPAVEEPREINAKFQSRLKGMLEEICQGLVQIEPVMADISVPIREFVDYLEFEIGKIQLEISRQKWEPVVDAQKVGADEAWLNRLVQLRNEFDVEKMTASVTMIRTVVATVQRTFGM